MKPALIRLTLASMLAVSSFVAFAGERPAIAATWQPDYPKNGYVATGGASLANDHQDWDIDVWGFPNRESTSFAAWRMQRDGHPITDTMRTGTSGNQFGNASNWAAHAASIGFSVTTSTSGIAGDIFQSSSLDHVGYVLVAGSQPFIEDYNDPAYSYNYNKGPWALSDMIFIHFGPSRSDLFLYNYGSGGNAKVMQGDSSGNLILGTPIYFRSGWAVYPGRFAQHVPNTSLPSPMTDLFLYNSSTGQTYVEFADGSGGWESHQGQQAFSTGWIVYTGDFNGDGLTDLFLYNPNTGATYVELANGSGWWNPVQGPQFITGWVFYPGLYSQHSNQSLTDLFLYNFTTGWTYVETANGSGGWNSHPGPTFSNKWTSINTGYFNKDLYLDLFLYDGNSGETYVELSDGNSGWSSAASPTWQPGWSVYTGDFNGDGLTDLFVYNSPNAYVEPSDGVGGWKPGYGPYTFTSGGVVYPWAVYPVVFDNQATMPSISDLFLYNPATGVTQVEMADGSYGWTPLQNPPTFDAGLTICPGNYDSP